MLQTKHQDLYNRGRTEGGRKRRKTINLEFCVPHKYFSKLKGKYLFQTKLKIAIISKPSQQEMLVFIRQKRKITDLHGNFGLHKIPQT